MSRVEEKGGWEGSEGKGGDMFPGLISRMEDKGRWEASEGKEGDMFPGLIPRGRGEGRSPGLMSGE